MSTAKGKELYYTALNRHAKSIGMKYTFGNPGTDTRPSYIRTVDNMIINEDSGTPSLSYLGEWHSSYAKRNFSFLAYEVLILDKAYVRDATRNVNYLFMTNDTRLNPYDSLPLYLEQLAATLKESYD